MSKKIGVKKTRRRKNGKKQTLKNRKFGVECGVLNCMKSFEKICRPKNVSQSRFVWNLKNSGFHVKHACAHVCNLVNIDIKVSVVAE